MVGGELLIERFAGTGSDGGGGVLGLVELLNDGGRKFADVGSIPADDESGCAFLASRHGAGLASIGVRWGRWETLLLKQLGDLTLNGLEAERGNAATEVFDGVEEPLVFGWRHGC